MGSSGAGKTSLLNVLSDRIKRKGTSKLTGEVKMNDSTTLTQGVFGSIASYVMQDDILFEWFTPREALHFAIRLKQKNLSKKEQEDKVEELLSELGLLSVSNTFIGSTKRKTLSGGERKRTAIAVELITNPSMIFLDEPTSGLDSFKALQIVSLLRKLAR